VNDEHLVSSKGDAVIGVGAPYSFAGCELLHDRGEVDPDVFPADLAVADFADMQDPKGERAVSARNAEGDARRPAGRLRFVDEEMLAVVAVPARLAEAPWTTCLKPASMVPAPDSWLRDMNWWCCLNGVFTGLRYPG
jgi:hypothetical protein